jgi:lipid-binding SYLF domain-containing protein
MSMVKLQQLLVMAGVALALAAGGASAQSDKAKKQAEVRKAAETSLEKFYKADPKLKDAVAKAPGYAVFTTFGLSFIVGGAGGKGVAMDNKTKQVTYMDMAQASAGFQAGVAESETLIIFNTPQSFRNFVDKGWEASGSGTAQAGAGGKSVGPGQSQGFAPDSTGYTLTKNGLQAGIAVAGTKYWKDKELN